MPSRPAHEADSGRLQDGLVALTCASRGCRRAFRASREPCSAASLIEPGGRTPIARGRRPRRKLSSRLPPPRPRTTHRDSHACGAAQIVTAGRQSSDAQGWVSDPMKRGSRAPQDGIGQRKTHVVATLASNADDNVKAHAHPRSQALVMRAPRGTWLAYVRRHVGRNIAPSRRQDSIVHAPRRARFGVLRSRI